MAHNPIIQQVTIGVFNFPKLGRTQQGVIQEELNYRRISPNDKISKGELFQLRNSTLYIVDCRTHHWAWEAQLPSKDDEHRFQYRIDLNYKVVDPEPIVRQNVVDLERILQQKMLPDLRLATSAAQLNEYQHMAKRLRNLISTHSCFLDYGLELDDEIHIEPILSDSDKVFVDELEQLIKARSIPRQAAFSGSLPSSQRMFKFDVEVNLQYLLVDSQLNRSINDLETNVSNLWRTQVHKTLRSESRKFSIEEIGEADEAVNAIFDDEDFEGYGVHVVSASATLELDEAALNAAKEDETRLREFDIDKQKQAHVRGTMLTDRMNFLASMLSKGDVSSQDVLKYLDEMDLAATDIPLDLIEKLKGLDILDRDTAEDVAKALLTSTLASAATKQVPNQANELLNAMVQRAKLTNKSSGEIDFDEDEDSDDSK